jgi:hypothetical protein
MTEGFLSLRLVLLFDEHKLKTPQYPNFAIGSSGYIEMVGWLMNNKLKGVWDILVEIVKANLQHYLGLKKTISKVKLSP